MRLGVNIDHVATLRQARGTVYPSPVEASLAAQRAGADGLTLHLREDRRHIQDDDVHAIRDAIDIPMNLEMAVTGEMIAFAKKIQPAFVCLVPERREELTTEGGLDVAGQIDKVATACQTLVDANIQVSLFIDADSTQIKAAAQVGAPIVELHTGHYADAQTDIAQQQSLDKLKQATQQADELGLQVNAGHGLHYNNVQAIAAIDKIIELNIGHAIIARAVFSGLETAVQEMRKLMQDARS